MLIWLKEMLPLVLQLLSELFRTDGEQKIGLGLKIAVLICCMLSAVSWYLGVSYFELYHTTLEAKVEVKRLTSVENELSSDLIELESAIDDYKKRLGKCNTTTNVPSDSYKQRHRQTLTPVPKVNTYKPDVEAEESYVDDLLRAING